ncbi:MAG: hypothetical protein QNJ09_16005 [Paracoccaceae bacterium]|nr:hypothetical protein [Paracoccaceae bacterium]
MGRVIGVLALVLALGACDRLGLNLDFGRGDNTFDGQYFRGSAKSDAKTRQNFTVSIRPVSRSLKGAVQAAEYEAISHCIKYYGTSDIAWTIGPDTPQDALPIDGETLTLAGTCEE